MACFESMAARRILLWYILIVSMVIIPLTMTSSMGCRFVLVESKSTSSESTTVMSDFTAFGIFNTPVVDETSGSLLGCVAYSQYWTEQTFDRTFRAVRFMAGGLMTFAALATIICLCLQCFSKSGKSWLWGVMRLSYLGALLCQGFVYFIFSTRMCNTLEGEASQCYLGRDGIIGAFNFIFLLGMVIATFQSFPPRHPVFQCWGATDTDDDEDDSDDDMSTKKDDLLQKNMAAVNEEENYGGDDVELGEGGNDNMSVSLFSGARSVVSIKSILSRKENTNADEIKKTDTDEEKSEDGMVEKKADSSGEKMKTLVVPTTVTSQTGSEEKNIVKKTSKSSVASANPENEKKPTVTAVASSKDSVNKKMATSVKATKTADDSQDNMSVSSKKSVGSMIRMFSRKGNKQSDKYLSKVDENGSIEDNKSKSEIMAENEASKVNTEDDNKVDNNDESDSESIQFLRSLAAVTRLGKGGLRVKTIERDHHIEMTDEYPAKAGEGLNAPHSSDGADVVKVRTEYYEGGSRTTKEITHHDGSRTVMTTIESKASAYKSDTDSISTKQSKRVLGGTASSVNEESRGDTEVSIHVEKLPSKEPKGGDDNASRGSRMSVRKAAEPIATLREKLEQKLSSPPKRS